jgi:hypothetical protein
MAYVPKEAPKKYNLEEDIKKKGKPRKSKLRESVKKKKAKDKKKKESGTWLDKLRRGVKKYFKDGGK